MSIRFNDTTTFKGLVQLYEREIGANRGDISGDSNKLLEFTAAVNQALDDYFTIALPAGGTWQLDDSNQTDYPIITTNLVSGQRDYAFTSDQAGNLILDIYRVFILYSATSTLYQEIFPVDQQSRTSAATYGFTNGQNTTGSPIWYDKTANGIFLNPIPGYNATNGLKVYINREASYFTSSNTTRMPGVPGLHHKYFYLKPAADYARRNTMSNGQAILNEVEKMEQRTIPEYFNQRARDERRQITTKFTQFR